MKRFLVPGILVCVILGLGLLIFSGQPSQSEVTRQVTEDLARLEEKLRGILTKQLPDLTGAGRRVAEARSLPRIGQALQQFYATLPAPQRNARPTPQRRTA